MQSGSPTTWGCSQTHHVVSDYCPFLHAGSLVWEVQPSLAWKNPPHFAEPGSYVFSIFKEGFLGPIGNTAFSFCLHVVSCCFQLSIFHILLNNVVCWLDICLLSDVLVFEAGTSSQWSVSSSAGIVFGHELTEIWLKAT